jgi:hypothetical protein
MTWLNVATDDYQGCYLAMAALTKTKAIWKESSHRKVSLDIQRGVMGVKSTLISDLQGCKLDLAIPTQA